MDYNQGTRDHYKDDAVASAYHRAFAGSRSWRDWRFRIVAHFERRAVRRMLERGPHRRVLDLPAGTGKLAPVFAALGTQVTASDVSANMLSVARQMYADIGYEHVSFAVGDASDFVATLGHDFDAVVCLRLLHRVPRHTRPAILEQLARAAPRAIVSFGIENRFHRARRVVRSRFLGGGNDRLCYDSWQQVRAEFERFFVFDRAMWILRGASQEIVVHARSRRYA